MSCIYVRCALHELIIINCEMSLLLVLLGAGPLSDCSGSQKVSVQIFQHIYLKLYSFLHRLAFPLLSSKFLSTEKENYNSSLSLNPCLGWTVVLFYFRSQESHRKLARLSWRGSSYSKWKYVCGWVWGVRRTKWPKNATSLSLTFSFEISFTCTVFLLWGDDIAAVGGNWLITIRLATS